jgi:hypothetical protein
MKRKEHYIAKKNKQSMMNPAYIAPSGTPESYRESGAASPFYGFGYFFGVPPTGQRR